LPQNLREEVGINVRDEVVIEKKNGQIVLSSPKKKLSSAGIFLAKNKYKLINKKREEVEFAIRVDNAHLTIEEISSWLKKNSRRTKAK